MDFSSLDVSGVLETADCGSFLPIELHNQDSISLGVSRNLEKSAPIVSRNLEDIILDAPKWLPFAAEQYEISTNIKDYFAVPVIIMPSDLPNRNMVAFPYSELSKFVPQARQISYESWRRCPTHIEHINRDWTKAKGVVLDSSMVPMYGRAGNLWKVVCLCAFDRSKDAALANDILTGRRQNYSMGALCGYYSCSVCGSLSEPGKGKALACGTQHIDPRSGKFRTFDTPQGRILGHFNAHNIQGFEISSVGVPAWPSASTSSEQHLII